METDRMTCPERAIRVFDFMALAVVALAVFAILRGGGDASALIPAELDRSWADLLLAIVAPCFLVGMLWFEKRRRAGEDEYLRRLIGSASSTGIFVTVCVWISWDLLAGSWVLAPSGDQILGVMLASTAAAYAWSRVRSG